MQATTLEDNSFFPREKEELPRAGLEPTMFTCTHVHIPYTYEKEKVAHLRCCYLPHTVFGVSKSGVMYMYT